MRFIYFILACLAIWAYVLITWPRVGLAIIVVILTAIVGALVRYAFETHPH